MVSPSWAPRPTLAWAAWPYRRHRGHGPGRSIYRSRGEWELRGVLCKGARRRRVSGGTLSEAAAFRRASHAVTHGDVCTMAGGNPPRPGLAEDG